MTFTIISNPRIFVAVLGVAAALALAGISMGVANAKPGGQELIIDSKSTLIVPGNSSTLAQGDVEYQEQVLFNGGACEVSCPSVVGPEVIGISRNSWMATEPIGTFGVIGTKVFSLPEGDIHVSARTVSAPPTILQGAIIGGTGDFRGAAGEYFSQGRFNGNSGESRNTFKFNSGQN